MKRGKDGRGRMEEGDEGREVGSVGTSSPWATGACARRRGSGGGCCPFMGSCGCLCIIVGARCYVGCLLLSMHGQLWLFVCQCGHSLPSVAGCGGALVVVCAWAVVVVCAPAWVLIMGCGGAPVVVHVWAAVVI